MPDLVVLTPDRDIQSTVRGLLERQRGLGIRTVSAEWIIDTQHDGSCLKNCVGLLRPYIGSCDRALVVFDLKGCGREAGGRVLLESTLESELARNGWEGRCSVVVIDPELEVWVWSDSPHVERILGWEGRTPALRDWLRSQGHLVAGQSKPSDPDTALRAALRSVRIPASPSLFQQLARDVGLKRCTDASFTKLRQTLSSWFSNDS